VTLLLALIHVPANLGYAAVGLFVGLESMGVPSPGETALVAGAIAAAGGHLSIELVILVATAAAIIGDNLGYVIGRHGGRRLLERPGLLYARRLALLDAGDRFFERHGAKAVFFGRWMALVRVTAAWMAGANRMPFRRFFLYNALGGVTWAAAVGLIAYGLGEAGAHVLTRVGTAGAVGAAILVVGAVIWLRRRERAHAARAQAAPASAVTPPTASETRGPATSASQPASGPPIGVDPRKTTE
jgi:membrane protein DedA with SNARE-associated domain